GLQALEHAEQREGDADLQKDQDGASGLAPDAGPYERQKSHHLTQSACAATFHPLCLPCTPPADRCASRTPAGRAKRCDGSEASRTMNTPSKVITPPAAFSPLVLGCLAATWLVWGSTYLTIRFALAGFAPYFLMATRF